MIVIPFDPDEEWGTRSEHRVHGTVNGMGVRGTIAHAGGGWAFTMTPMMMRGTDVGADADVTVELAPEGPQRADLDHDIAAALDAIPDCVRLLRLARAVLPQGVPRWIDGASRRPELCARHGSPKWSTCWRQGSSRGRGPPVDRSTRASAGKRRHTSRAPAQSGSGREDPRHNGTRSEGSGDSRNEDRPELYLGPLDRLYSM